MSTSITADAPRNYQLSDDLARLCLPREFKDTHRLLAWVNSICFLFLVVGMVGLKPPPVIQKPINEPTEIVPVVFTPPEEPPQTKPDEPQDLPQEVPEITTDVPQVVTVVAAADAPNIAFSVPVQGAVAISPTAQMAPPPPRELPPPPKAAAPPKPVKFNPSTASDGGIYPDPKYPMAAMRSRYQGTVTLLIEVEPSGAVSSVKVQKTSGYNLLDDAAVDAVKNRWRFPAGEKRLFQWDCIFRM